MAKREMRNNEPAPDTLDYQKDLIVQNHSYKTLIDHLPQKIFLKDSDSVYISCNDNMARDLHIKANELLGKTDYDFFPREMADKYRADDKKVLDSGKSEELEEKYLQNGQLFYVHTVKTPVKDAAGKTIGILGIYWDITERKRLEKELEENRHNLERIVKERTEELHRRYKQLQHEVAQRKYFEDLFSAVFTNSPIGMYLVQKGKFVLCSPEFVRNVGYDMDELIGMSSLNIVIPEELEDVRQKAIDMLKGLNSTPYEFRTITKDGKILWALETVVSVTYQGERAVLGNFMDITQRKELEQKYELLATHDALTGLPSRLLLYDRLNHALEQAKRRNAKLAVMMIDLDHFKNINDTLGHDAGDKLLQAVSNGLTAVTRNSDTVARIGGDEFVVLLSEITDIKQSCEIAGRILEHFRMPLSVDGHEIQVTLSIGISIFPDNGADTEELLKLADKALYAVKDKGRNNYLIYSQL